MLIIYRHIAKIQCYIRQENELNHKYLCKNTIKNDRITAPKKNAGRSISFLPTSCRFAKVCYFYVGKKENNISATNKHCVGRKHFGFNTALLLAAKLQVQVPRHLGRQKTLPNDKDIFSHINHSPDIWL